MSEFDELFNSIQTSNIVDIIRDSKIELVTEFDADHPLRTGEYFYDENSNTLYVGAGDLQPKPVYVSAVSHNTRIVYIPAPRVSTSHSITIPKLSYTTNVTYMPTPRITMHKDITIPSINKNTIIRVVTKNLVSINWNVSLPTITHSTSIQKL